MPPTAQAVALVVGQRWARAAALVAAHARRPLARAVALVAWQRPALVEVLVVLPLVQAVVPAHAVLLLVRVVVQVQLRP